MSEKTINERIKEIRLHLKLSQAKFCESLFLSCGHYAEVELGNRRVNERLVKLIGSVYSVNEDYLKTGQGDMFRSKCDHRLERIIALFNQFPPEYKDFILRQIELLKEFQKRAG